MIAVRAAAIMRRVVLVALPAIVVTGAILAARQARVRAANDLSTSCYGSLTTTTYPSGVASAGLSFSNGVMTNGSSLQLNTALTPLNSQKIVLPFDQNVYVRFVYENTGGHAAMGWFYLDTLSYWFDSNGNLIDNDGDGVPDFFEFANGTTRPQAGIYSRPSPSAGPYLANGSVNYSDGGLYAHLPNVIEATIGPGKGGILFNQTEDDAWWDPGESQGYDRPVANDSILDPMVVDKVSNISADGIPDYDVNGDNQITVADRSINLGLVQGNREIVIWALEPTVLIPNKALGLGTSGGNYAYAMWFTKNIMNADSGSNSPRTIQNIAIGCAQGDSTCVSARPGATAGWLDGPAVQRLADPTNVLDYHLLNLSGDMTVIPVVIPANGSEPHFVVAAPNSNPNMWLLAFDDNSGTPGSGTDFDFNDVVILIDRINGGEAVSNVVSTAIPAAQLPNTVISQVRVQYAASFPAPGCTGVAAQVLIYYSVDNGVTWHQVSFASGTAGDVTIDVLGAGFVGNQLKWKADFISPVQACQPKLDTLNIGYQAISNGVFKYTVPIPLSNEIYGGALETPSFPATEPAPTNNDFSLRGHFFSNKIYEPTAPSTTLSPPPLEWDAGPKLSATDPGTRNIYTAANGATIAFSTANATTLYPLILNLGARTTLQSGSPVYDYNGDGLSNDIDAQFLLQWTRGWEVPAGITFTPAATVQPLARAWRLASVHNSAPAIVGPPVRPVWIDGPGVPPALVAKHNVFDTTYASRPTRAVVGSQDGMLHAFDAGQYRPFNDPACPAVLNRGCYAGANDAARYGAGTEIWAWVPPSQISQLKNNPPKTRTYLPTSNPQAEVDGSVAVDDVWDPSLNGTGDFRTMAFASLGTSQRYITAVDMTKDVPVSLWSQDFTDTNFNGSNLSPSVGLTLTTASPGYKHVIAVSSGLGTVAGDLYIYLLDALTGTQLQKLKLNTGSNAAQAYGIASYVNMIDADQDGLIDRVYAADTSGRIWKVDTKTNTTCMIASTGQTIYSGMAATVTGSTAQPKVQLFVGGGPNPDGSGTIASQYNVFSFQDNDPVGTCSNASASLVYSVALASGNRVWAAPAISGTNVFFATANASSASICANGTGTLLTLSTAGNGSGQPASQGTPQTISGSPVSSIRVYDGHALVNSVGGSTTIIGSGGWNNAGTGQGTNGSSGQGLISAIRTLVWQEY